MRLAMLAFNMNAVRQNGSARFLDVDREHTPPVDNDTLFFKNSTWHRLERQLRTSAFCRHCITNRTSYCVVKNPGKLAKLNSNPTAFLTDADTHCKNFANSKKRQKKIRLLTLKQIFKFLKNRDLEKL
jgi:hypothetical protein